MRSHPAPRSVASMRSVSHRCHPRAIRASAAHLPRNKAAWAEASLPQEAGAATGGVQGLAGAPCTPRFYHGFHHKNSEGYGWVCRPCTRHAEGKGPWRAPIGRSARVRSQRSRHVPSPSGACFFGKRRDTGTAPSGRSRTRPWGSQRASFWSTGPIAGSAGSSWSASAAPPRVTPANSSEPCLVPCYPGCRELEHPTRVTNGRRNDAAALVPQLTPTRVPDGHL